MTFESIYRNQSRYCLILVSPEYRDGIWTNVERRQAISRAIQNHGSEYILPVVVEPAEIPGLPDTIGWLSIDTDGIDKIVDVLLSKIRKARGVL